MRRRRRSRRTRHTRRLTNPRCRALIIPHTPRQIRQLRRTHHLLPARRRIIRVLEPVKAPIAPWLQLIRERIALAARRDATVLRAPAVGGRAPLVCAPVEDPDAAARHREVEVVGAEVAAGVGGLDDEFFARDGAGGEGESGVVLVSSSFQTLNIVHQAKVNKEEDSLITRTTPTRLRAPCQLDRRKPITQIITDRPWALVRAHERGPVGDA
jgi:hypothetical protein